MEEPINDINSNSLSRHKKLFSVIGIIVVLIVITIIFILLSLLPQNSARKPFPSTPIPTTFIGSRQPSISEKNIKLVVNKIVKNIHWLNDNELAYTYYDDSTKKTVIAKTDQTGETVLSNQQSFKFSQFFWANDGKLLVLDFIYPNKVYLLTNSSLENVSISGYGFSWSPDSKRLFYLDTSQENNSSLKYFSILDKNSALISLPPPEFSDSLWSPDGNNILTYNQGPDVENTKMSILNISSNRFTLIDSPQASSPMWSPSGQKLAYITPEGLRIKIIDQDDTLLYKIQGSLFGTTFTWVTDDELLLIDSTLEGTRFITISVNNKANQEVLQNIHLQVDQRIEIVLSPNKKKIALATEKDGLIFVTLN